MGYYTMHDVSNNSQEVIDALTEQSGYDSLDEGVIKWYTQREDCKKVSLMFPDTVIEVSGEGEESWDIWTAYYKNGKEQYEKAKTTVDPFDESKLK